MHNSSRDKCHAPGAGGLRLGWAAIDITPDRPANLFGMFNERISTHVAEPVMATALALEGADGTQAIWVSCDILNIPLDVTTEVRNAVAARAAGFRPEHLLISCTHTHNAPNFYTDLFPPPPPGAITPAEYRAYFIGRVTQAAVQAWQARAAGQVSPALGHAVLGWCRRVVFANGSGEMYGNARRDDFVRVEGPMDPGVEILFTHDAGGDLTGAMINITCTAQTCMGDNTLTADLWAPVRRQLRAHFGGQFQVLAIAGAAGDQCPDDLIRWKRSEPEMRGPQAAEILARRLTNAVIEAYQHGRRPMGANPVFRHRHTLIDLPLYVMSDAEVQGYRDQIARLTARGEPDRKSWDGGTLHRAREHLRKHMALGSSPRIMADCNFLRIGDMAIATNPFELYLEYGQRIKGRSPALQTVTPQLTNDRLSYLPTAAALKHGHYSAMPSNIRVSPQGGDKLVEDSLAELRALWE